jgi:hypothetical protein
MSENTVPGQLAGHDISHPVAKFIAAISVYITIDWLTAAGKVAGALLSMALLSEWVWKRIVKPLLIRTGVIRGKRRDFLESTDRGELES